MSWFSRFLFHFRIVMLFASNRNSYNSKYRTFGNQLINVLLWLLIVPLKFLELIGFFDGIDLLRRAIFRSRKLTDFEIDEVSLVFKDSIDLTKVRIRENSFLAKIGAKSAKKLHLGFVLFKTVNFSRKLDYSTGIADMSWLVHELVHVAQYKKMGINYIVEALRAQKLGGYNFGGIQELKNPRKLSDFNLEQQADIAKFAYKSIKTQSHDVAACQSYLDELVRLEF